MSKKHLSGLQRICKLYGRMKCGDTMMVWDYANGVEMQQFRYTRKLGGPEFRIGDFLIQDLRDQNVNPAPAS